VKLTPLDIKKQEFKRSLRGYDPVEVDAFLDMVADEFEAVIREKNHMADEILKLRTQLQDYQQVERSLKETLVNAQENITASRQTSQREADIILREAELKASKIIENAKIKLARLKNDIMVIRAQKESFARRLRHLLESQIELINVLELDDLGYEDEHAPPGKNETSGKKLPESARRKVNIPLAEEKSSPLVHETTNRQARTGEKEAAPKPGQDNTDQSKEDSGYPKISDQFIT